MKFIQEPPELGNQFEDDVVLKNYLHRQLDDSNYDSESDRLAELGRLAGEDLYELQMSTLDEEASLQRWSPWGDRIDKIQHTRVWQEAESVAREFRLVGSGYDEHANARIRQFARVYLFGPSTDTYTCPLAMTDGAARTILASGNDALIDEVVPHLIGKSEDPWTSGQWMTETAGGSDVSTNNTTARETEEGWELHGRKWFTSAIDSEMALALARPEKTDDDDLALFYVRTRDDSGYPQGFRVTRLKDKLGTRELPTAEILLEGTPAEPVDGLSNGVRKIFPMLNTTRTWNAVCSAAAMRRGIALGRDYARKREVFGEPLADKPLHESVMGRLEAETQGAFQLSFFAAELLGNDSVLKRFVIPLAKLYTGRQAARVSSEVIELFGGAGYVEDTGLPKILRDAQVLPIWEGTTNVLSLEVLRQVANEGIREELVVWIDTLRENLSGNDLQKWADGALSDVRNALSWIEENGENFETLQAQARNLSYVFGDALEVLLLARQAQWERNHDVPERAESSCRELASGGSVHPGGDRTPIG
jgi:alkylation response protein AidB-like acyl-CoA dehydrogenase